VSDGPEPGTLTPGCDGEPDLALTLSPDDARSVRDGELAPSVAFMQGRLKTSGDNALLLRVLAWTATPAFPTALSKWAQAQ
jgi:putative sterol carrier protein